MEFFKWAVKMLLVIVVGTTGGLVVVRQYQQWQAEKEPTATAQKPRALSKDNPPSPESFYPENVVPRQQPLTEFQTVPVSEAGDRIDDRELVLGVVVGDEARAYPINMMTGPRREIFNDTLGGRAIAATW